MVELYPAPFRQLIRRMFLEYQQEDKIFDLPKSKFYRSDTSLDTRVSLHGEIAATPVGPAAGPQSQLAQNIVLSWLAGSRILEFKTVQINDELKIPRPCIDATNVGYNVEWSQELKLAHSLQEYVAGSMLIDMLKHMGIPGPDHQETVFDMSVGYDLAGIRSPQVTGWMQQLRDASPIVEQLRAQIPDEFAHLRDIDFRTRISDSITLSTFHGCPANEIERIVEYLLGELDIHTIIKMNPTLLGIEAVEHLLHDRLGYQDIRVTQDAFDKDLQFDQALEICDRLGQLAARKGKKLGVKFSNTLVIVNHRSFFTDEVMYMSGAPLHVVTLNLVEKFRQAVGPDMPISFSAGIDQTNFPEAVAQGFVPVTTCTDLLRPGGYGRLPAYLNRLHQKMRAVNAHNISDYIIKAENNAARALAIELEQLSNCLDKDGRQLSSSQREILDNWRDNLNKEFADRISDGTPLTAYLYQQIDQLSNQLAEQQAGQLLDSLTPVLSQLPTAIVKRAGWLNTSTIVPRTTADARYAQTKNSAIPRKIGSKLWLYDCINCDKCIPVCPNDANFSYDIAPFDADCLIYQVNGEQIETRPGRALKVAKSHQIGNFADFCNECGNCDIFCPEDGGPYLEKPRFFGTLETMRLHSSHDGCYFEREMSVDRVYGRFRDQEYLLEVDRASNQARFSDGRLALTFDRNNGQCLATEQLMPVAADYQLDNYYYYVLNSLLDGILNSDQVNYLNIAYKPVVSSEELGA